MVQWLKPTYLGFVRKVGQPGNTEPSSRGVDPPCSTTKLSLLPPLQAKQRSQKTDSSYEQLIGRKTPNKRKQIDQDEVGTQRQIERQEDERAQEKKDHVNDIDRISGLTQVTQHLAGSVESCVAETQNREDPVHRLDGGEVVRRVQFKNPPPHKKQDKRDQKASGLDSYDGIPEGFANRHEQKSGEEGHRTDPVPVSVADIRTKVIGIEQFRFEDKWNHE